MNKNTKIIEEAHILPPHSSDAEQGVLSSMLIDPKCISEVADKANKDYFYIPAHQSIYSALIEEWEANKVIDLITFTQSLRDKHLLDSVGGAPFVTALYTFVPSSANVGYYLDILRDKFVLRSVISAASQSITRAYNEQENAENVLAQSNMAFEEISAFPTKEKSVNDLIQEKLERMQSGEPDEDVVKTFLKDLDLHSPLRLGEMPLITGARKSGKSITALSIFENITLGNKKPGLWFSLEDPAAKVIDRLTAGVSRIPSNKHHVSKLSEEELRDFQTAANKIGAVNIHIYSDAFDLPVIIARSKKVKQANPDLAVIVVDYAQLVRVPFKKGQNRESEVAEVSRALRLLAMELNVPVIVISQLNTDGFSRESRALENDATANWNIENTGEEGKRLLNIRWQRDGESDISFPVTFLGAIARVENFRSPSEIA